MPAFAQESPNTTPASEAQEATQPSDDTARAPIDESTLRFAPVDDQPQNDADDAQVRAFGIGDILRTLLVLALVAGAVYGVVALLRRRLPGNSAEHEDTPLRLLASRGLSPGRQLHAVMVGKTVYLVGDAEGGVTLLQAIEDQETIDELVLAHSAQAPARRSFGNVLGRWLSTLAVPERTAAQSKTPADSSLLKGQARRLRQLR